MDVRSKISLSIHGHTLQPFDYELVSLSIKGGNKMEKIAGESLVHELQAAGFQGGVAVATNAEVAAGAACGQVAFENLPKVNPDGTEHQVVVANIGAGM
ncbi:hypothetical protein [Yersinia phage vB_YenM_P778]